MYLDAGDFYNIADHNHRWVDLAKLEFLAEKVYAGGGREILKMMVDIKAGRRIDV